VSKKWRMHFVFADNFNHVWLCQVVNRITDFHIFKDIKYNR